MSMDNNTLYWGNILGPKAGLEKLPEKLEELNFYIYVLKEQLKKYDIKYAFKEKKVLLYTCCEIYDLLKDFRFILNLSFYDKTNMEQLTISTIINNLYEILTTNKIGVSKFKFNDLVDVCLFNLEVFYEMLNDFITEEYKLIGDV